MLGERGKVAVFASANPVFTRQNWRSTLFPDQPITSADALLAHHVSAGAFIRAAAGVYASVPAHLAAESFVPDRDLVASMIRPDGVLAYHTALELHGLNYSEGSEAILTSSGRPGTYQTRVGVVRFVMEPAALRGLPPERLGVETIDRRGLKVMVTTVERTIVDCLDRPGLAGGLEELSYALQNVQFVDAGKIIALVADRHNRSLAGIAGWWLERNRDRLMITDDHLEQLQRLAPNSLHPVLGAQGDEGVVDRRWNVRLPSIVANPEFEDTAGMSFV